MTFNLYFNLVFHLRLFLFILTGNKCEIDFFISETFI